MPAPCCFSPPNAICGLITDHWRSRRPPVSALSPLSPLCLFVWIARQNVKQAPGFSPTFSMSSYGSLAKNATNVKQAPRSSPTFSMSWYGSLAKNATGTGNNHSNSLSTCELSLFLSVMWISCPKCYWDCKRAFDVSLADTNSICTTQNHSLSLSLTNSLSLSLPLRRISRPECHRDLPVQIRANARREQAGYNLH